MIKFLKNKTFIFGFFVGIVIAIFLNIYQIYTTENSPCHHCTYWYGFPLPFYERYVTSCEFSGGLSFGCYVSEFSWIGTIANILVAIFFSFVLGLIFKFVWSKIAARKLN